MKSEEYEKAEGLKKSENQERKLNPQSARMKGNAETDLQQSPGPTSPSEFLLFFESFAGPTPSRVFPLRYKH
jgi:hypothetical protein